jgi:hypothetical protein
MENTKNSPQTALPTPISKGLLTRREFHALADDPLWKLVGIGHSGKGDISENKHTYLAEAYLHHKQA